MRHPKSFNIAPINLGRLRFFNISLGKENGAVNQGRGVVHWQFLLQHGNICSRYEDGGGRRADPAAGRGAKSRAGERNQ